MDVMEQFMLSWLLWLSGIAAFCINLVFILRTAARRADSPSESRVDRPDYVTPALLVIFILINLIGMVFEFINWVPVTEYVEGMELFYILRPSVGMFGLTLIPGAVCMYLRRESPL